MDKMLQNNIDNAELLQGQKERLSQSRKFINLNRNYLQSLKDSIKMNEDSKLVISSRINSSKERTENISKQFTFIFQL